MSGSPVYFDGKLAGALAFRIGEFSKEPIAGVTPIEEMLEINALDRRPAAAPMFALRVLPPSILPLACSEPGRKHADRELPAKTQRSAGPELQQLSEAHRNAARVQRFFRRDLAALRGAIRRGGHRSGDGHWLGERSQAAGTDRAGLRGQRRAGSRRYGYCRHLHRDLRRSRSACWPADIHCCSLAKWTCR